MQLSPSCEAASCAATQELASILRNLWFHYRAHKSPPLVNILSQIDPVHTIPFHSISLRSIPLSYHMRLLYSDIYGRGTKGSVSHLPKNNNLRLAWFDQLKTSSQCVSFRYFNGCMKNNTIHIMGSRCSATYIQLHPAV
jgi:hypothetical protein